jgi:hypothetical protein
MTTRPILSIHPVLFAVAASGALAAGAWAQDSFIYAFNSEGRVVANGYALDDLENGKEKVDEDETWRDLFVKGPDRWLLRGDGRIARNGELLTDDLEGDEDWRAIVVDDSDVYTAVRLDGHVAGPSGSLVNLPQGDFAFLDMVTNGTAAFVLKTNGGVFRVPGEEPLILFDGPQGEIDGAADDGEGLDVSWVRLKINPVDGKMWALRGDGTIMNADIPLLPPVTPDSGTIVVQLPYDNTDEFISINELYTDFDFDAAGGFFAIRADGKLYSTASPVAVLADFDGDPEDDVDETYVAVRVIDDVPHVLRSDGKIFRDVAPDPAMDLKDSVYRGLELGSELPDLANVKNKAPVISATTITAPEGSDLTVPVIVADRDLPADQLVVAVVPETLPAGAAFDDVTRVLTWPDAGPAGTYKVKITVDDGIAKPVTGVQTLTIKPLDTNETKNIKPTLVKVKGANALVGLPFELQLSAFDLDGDPVTLQLNPAATLPEGADFDAGTQTLTWDAPQLTDTGTREFKFLVSDGTVEVKQSVKVKVVSSLLGF